MKCMVTICVHVPHENIMPSICSNKNSLPQPSCAKEVVLPLIANQHSREGAMQMGQAQAWILRVTYVKLLIPAAPWEEVHQTPHPAKASCMV